MDALPLVALVAVSAVIAGAARRTPVPAPLLLVAVGLIAAYVPGVPDYTLDPHIVLPLLLPPAAAHGRARQLVPRPARQRAARRAAVGRLRPLRDGRRSAISPTS